MKKSFCLLLVLALLAGCLPLSALADETTVPITEDPALTEPEPDLAQDAQAPQTDYAFGSVSIFNGCRTLDGQVPLAGSDRKLPSAQSAIVYERDTKTLVYAYNPDAKLAPGALSKIVNALIAAAENGKEVVAMVELRARFDEQNNIDWSKQLEGAGCTVIYGFDDYKVHSKLTLITRKGAQGYSYITQIGTGNYNEKTSELYTDYSFITADPVIGEEASNVFQNLAVQRLTEDSSKMLVAPLRFKSVLLEEMDHLIAAARMGRPASMILKNNSISDRDIILKLQEASCAGVRIDMIVRGICCVRAEVPGKTENLHIRSLVGRYLEHGRIYSFFDGVHTRIYIASGDFLTRNTECRVEVGVRVEDPVLVQKLTDILQLQLRDNVNAREMRPDGSYQKVKPAEGEALVNGQMDMYELLGDDWTGKAPACEKTAPAAVEAPTEPLTAEAPAAEPSAEKPEAKAVEFPAQKQEPKKAPEPPAPIHLDAAPKPEEHDHFDELEQMVNRKKPAPRPASVPKPAKPAVSETPAQKSRLKKFLDLFKFRR